MTGFFPGIENNVGQSGWNLMFVPEDLLCSAFNYKASQATDS